MLTVIKNVIEFNKGKNLTVEKQAEDILKNIEHYGMKPPDRQRCFCHDCNCSPDHTWEPENEKKHGTKRN